MKCVQKSACGVKGASTGNRLINGSQWAQKGPVGGPRSRELAIMAAKITPVRVVVKVVERVVEKGGEKFGERVTEKGIQKGIQKSIQKKVAKIALELGDKTRVETRVEIIQIMKENPSITVGEIAKATGLTIKGVEWNIKGLKQKGLIKRIGPNKGGHWEVVKG